MGRKTLQGGGSPISIRVSDQLKTDLAKAAEGLGLSEHDTLRLAMQIGFKHFAAIDHNLAEAVMAQSGLTPKQSPHTVIQGQAAFAVGSPSNITPMPPQSIAADQADDTSDIPPAQKVNYGFGKKKPKQA